MSTLSTSAVTPRVPLVSRKTLIDWLGIAPFTIFALLFLIVPTVYLMVGAFLTPEVTFTLKNIYDLFTPSIMDAYWISIKISVASSLGGALIGFFLAWAIVLGSPFIRPVATASPTVASSVVNRPEPSSRAASWAPSRASTGRVR